MDEQEYAEYRRNRVRRLKKIIPVTIFIAILIPLLCSIIFLSLFIHTKRELNDLQTRYDELLSSMEQLRDDIDYIDETKDVYTVSDVTDSKRESTEESASTDEVIPDTEEDVTDVREVYLTFDDGPSSNTGEILDILAKYDVKATFFVTGKTDEVSVAAYKRIVDEGHTLGMHSYSHRYSQVYASKESFIEDLTRLQEYLYEVTGVWSRYYRFPGGSSNTASTVDMKELIEYLSEQDITYFDWNIVSGDASGNILSADRIYENCVSNLPEYSEAVILMHDAAEKHTTVEALPRIIEAVQAMDDTRLMAINDDTFPIQHRE
ncbi:MAG: polysaccharide deacetylase [Lachnospiraceae bacterium]|nr:polysaccharide deacetylase [Lachnospiraceae bacterium]